MKTKTTAFLVVATLLAAHVWMRRANTGATPVAQDKTAAIDRIFSWVTPASRLRTRPPTRLLGEQAQVVDQCSGTVHDGNWGSAVLPL